MVERVEKPEAEALAVARPGDNVTKAEELAARLECPENLRGVQNRLYEVRPAARLVMARTGRGKRRGRAFTYGIAGSPSRRHGTLRRA